MITTYSGLSLDFSNIQPDAIDINDIAHGLAREGRWANQTLVHYTVAEHSVQMSYLSDFPREALLHDATEAYMRDIPAPLKALVPAYKRIEDELAYVIFKKFGLDWDEFPPEVHKWDKEMRDIEFRHFVRPKTNVNWTALDFGEAKEAFLKRFNELWNI